MRLSPVFLSNPLVPVHQSLFMTLCWFLSGSVSSSFRGEGDNMSEKDSDKGSVAGDIAETESLCEFCCLTVFDSLRFSVCGHLWSIFLCGQNCGI